MQDEHVVAPIQGVGDLVLGIKSRVPRGGHNCSIEQSDRCLGRLGDSVPHRRAAGPPRLQHRADPGENCNRSMISFKSFRGTSAVLAWALLGCTPNIDYHGYMAKPGAFAQIHEGMPKSEVEATLGSPSTTASVKFNGD